MKDSRPRSTRRAAVTLLIGVLGVVAAAYLMQPPPSVATRQADPSPTTDAGLERLDPAVGSVPRRPTPRPAGPSPAEDATTGDILPAMEVAQRAWPTNVDYQQMMWKFTSSFISAGDEHMASLKQRAAALNQDMLHWMDNPSAFTLEQKTELVERSRALAREIVDAGVLPADIERYARWVDANPNFTQGVQGH